jgi:protein O-mannosyl-transferase
MAKKQTTPAAPANKRPTPPAPTKPAEPLTRFFTGGFWRNHWIPSLLMMLLSVNLYYASTKFGYVLDDEMVVWKNAYVQEGFSGIGKIFGSDSFMGYFQKKEDLYKLEGGRYRPLSLVTFAIETDVFGKSKAEMPTPDPKTPNAPKSEGRGNAQISHWVNILLYGLNGVLLYAVLLGLFPPSEQRKWYVSVAFIAAILFVFHPLHTECVANIKGRDEILALMGSLGALYATMKYFDTNKMTWLLASGVFFLLGLFAKENTLTFLAVIPLTVWFFGKVPRGRAIGAAVPLMVAAFIFIAMRYSALGYMLSHGKVNSDLMNDSFLGMNMGEKTATIFLTLGWYLKLLVYPWQLTHDYYPYHVPKVGWGDWRALLSLALYAGASIWAVLNLRKRPVPAYAVLFFILTISIVSNLFVSVGSFMNERFAYMPSVAFCILLAWGLFEWLPKRLGAQNFAQYAGYAVLLPFLGFFGWKTLQRVPDWENMFTLNASAVKMSPNSARAQSFYATALYQEVYSKATTKEEKLALVDTMAVHIKKALDIYPNYGSAWVMYCNNALARFDQDRQMDRLFNDLSYCLEKNPYNTLMRSNIDLYMKYLAQNGGNPNKIVTFAYRIGYEEFYQKRKDIKSALQFLLYGDMAQWHEPRLYDALVEVYTAANQPQKAAEMKIKGDAARAW